MQQQQQLNEDLFSSLSLAVQEIQAQFARGTDVIWNCYAVDRLCYCMEDILSHGLKEGLLSWASSTEISFWSLAVKITCKKDIQDILRLNLKSDREKCMSWIRQGLRENTLGSYINVITQDEKLLREFYHSYAFLCDSKKAETVKNLLTYGISQLDFDISLTSNTRRPVTSEAKPVLASDMMISHLPLRQSDPPNGYTSPFDSLTNSKTPPHVHGEETVSSKTEEYTRKKRKKKKKAGVAMIAESVDTQDSQWIDQAMQMHHDLDVHDGEPYTNVENSLFPSEQGSGNENDRILENHSDHIVESDTHCEDVRATGVVLTMELPVTERVFQELDDKKKQGESKSDSERAVHKKSIQDECYCVNNGTQEAGNADDVSPPGNTNDSQCESNACRCADNVLLSERFGDGKDHFSKGNVSEPVAFQTQQQSDIQKMEDKANDISSPSVEETVPLSDNCSSDAGADMSSEPAIEKNHNSVSDDSEFTQHRVALATFECGTPKKIDDISEIEKERAFLSTSYEGEDFNIIPGIHKSNDKLSRSGSSGSFTGSGSFQPPSRTGSRNNTMDSLYRSSTFGSSTTSDSWKYVTGSQSGLSRNNSKADLGIGSPSSEDHFSEFELFDDLLGLQEDHFSPPESFMGVSTSEELEHGIQSCKDLISTTSDDSEEKQKLINKLVQLRLRLQETLDTRSESDPDATKVLGHLFSKVEERGSKTSCDKCGKVIWIWQSLFTCKACNYHSHRRCLDMIRRPCASRKVSVSTYNVDICPEIGLSSQQYKCAECRKQIGLTRGERSEARLCDYTGQYYCEECHWNDLLIIPARVVHNWDFTAYKVSRQAKQLLALMISRPLLKIEKLNPALLKFVVELREVKRLREEVLIMKKYFMTCRQALDSKLLLQLKDRQHFVDNSNLYSLQDLIDVNSGSLLPFLTKIHSLFLTHIKSDCPLCQAKGFVCELCQSNEVIFAFDPHVSQCISCRSVYHKICFKAGICPKCERRHKRGQTSQ